MENTNEERNVALNEEQKNNTILDQGIEQIQVNGGISEAAMEADIASESLDSFFYDETEDNNDSPSENEIEAAERAYQEWEEMLDDNQIAEEIIEKNQRKEPADVDVKTNYVLNKLSKAGIEVVTDKQEFNEILENIEELNITLEMLNEKPNHLQKISSENDSEPKVGQDTTSAISTPNNQNHIVFIENSQQLYYERLNNMNASDNSPEEFYHNLRKVFDVDDATKESGYIYQKQGEDFYKLRIANHLITVKNRTGAKTHQTSIVIKFTENKRRTNEKARVIEYVYNPDNLTSKKMNGIISGIKDWLKTGEYTDKNFDEKFISHAEMINGKVEIIPNANVQKMTSSEYNNKEVDAFVTDKSGFVDPEKIAAIDLYGFEEAKKMWKDGEPDWDTRMMLQDKSISDYLNLKRPNIYNYQINDVVYGFAYEGKIYLNPDVMNSEVAIHEYTHLWDAYTQKTNPELWEKGLNIFKGTSLWNEVLEDENYADIKDDENLVLSECHARICGKIADAVLQKVLERDGDLKKAEMIDWDMECSQYLFNELKQNNEQLRKEDFFEVVNFMATPMKDLFQRELKLKIEQIKENKVDNDYTPKYPAYMENRFVLEQNHPDGWAVGKNMWVIWDNLLQHSGRSGGFFNTGEGIAAGNKELNEIIDSVKKSETEALEKVYEGNGAYTCQLFSDYSGYGSTTTRHEMLFATAKENSHGSIIDAVGVRESEVGTIKGYAKAFANRNNFAADSLLIAFNPTDTRKNANKQWTELSILAKEKNISFVYQDGETESRYAFALDYAHKHNLPCFLLDNEISRKIAQNVESVTFYKDYEDLINKVNAMAEEQTVSASVQKADRQVSVEKEKSTNELNYHGLTLLKKDNNLIEPAYDILLIKGIDDKTDSKLVEMMDNSAKWNQYCISNNSENFIPAIAAQIVLKKKEVQNENINKSFIEKVQELKEKVTKSLKKNVAVGIALTSIFSANPNLFAQTKTVVPASEQKIIKEAEKEKEELLKTYKNKSPEELLNLILAANEAKTAAKIEASREQDKNQVLEKENKELKVKNEKLDFYKEHYKTKSAVQESFYEEKKKTQDMYESLKRSSQEDHDILYKHAKIVVNGKERVCHTGLVNGFKNCVERLDNAVKLNNELVKENRELRNILNRSNQNERNGVSY